ncbi:10818_t:CDS:2, partial [Entrophospora sp. SA101]
KLVQTENTESSEEEFDSDVYYNMDDGGSLQVNEINDDNDDTLIKSFINGKKWYKFNSLPVSELTILQWVNAESSALRSRICHPDKFPEYPKATEAFQKLSYAYETLNKSSTRRAYDISGTSNLGSVNGTGDDTLHGVLYQLFLEFMDGDFEMIRSLVNALNEGNPELNLGEDTIETIETVFRGMRETLLAMKAEFKQLGGKGIINKGLLGDSMAKVVTGLVTCLEAGEQYI